MELAPGYMVNPSVRLERRLGQARLGSLWSAKELTLGTEVAVQILPMELGADLDVLERFLYETQRAARIDSPHVVRILHVGVTPDDLHYVVTERIEGQSLGSRVRHEGALTPEDVVTVVHQTASALAAAHRLGIFHRGVIPARIMLCGPRSAIEVKLLDFDIVNQHEHPVASRRGMTLDLASSMSPEQLLVPDEVDGRADLWSLSVAAYFALTGRMPFWGDSYTELFTVIDAGTFRPPSDLHAGLSPAIDAFFARAFRRSLEDRFATAGELDEAFRRAVYSERGRRPATLADLTAPFPRPAVSDAPMALDALEASDEATTRPRRSRLLSLLFLPATAAAAALLIAGMIREYPEELRAATSGGFVESPASMAAALVIERMDPAMILDEQRAEPESTLPVDAAEAPVALVPAPAATRSPSPSEAPAAAPERRVLKVDDDPDHRRAREAEADAPVAPPAADERVHFGP